MSALTCLIFHGSLLPSYPHQITVIKWEHLSINIVQKVGNRVVIGLLELNIKWLRRWQHLKITQAQIKTEINTGIDLFIHKWPKIMVSVGLITPTAGFE